MSQKYQFEKPPKSIDNGEHTVYYQCRNKKGGQQTMARKLTDAELREWGERLNPDRDWEGVTPQMVYHLMVETAGGNWESGEAEWDFDLSDAQRLIKLMEGNNDC